jgi:hypothetical protein
VNESIPTGDTYTSEGSINEVLAHSQQEESNRNSRNGSYLDGTAVRNPQERFLDRLLDFTKIPGYFDITRRD